MFIIDYEHHPIVYGTILSKVRRAFSTLNHGPFQHQQNLLLTIT